MSKKVKATEEKCGCGRDLKHLGRCSHRRLVESTVKAASKLAAREKKRAPKLAPWAKRAEAVVEAAQKPAKRGRPKALQAFRIEKTAPDIARVFEDAREIGKNLRAKRADVKAALDQLDAVLASLEQAGFA